MAVKEFNLFLSVDRVHIPARLMLAKIHRIEKEEVKAIFQYRRIIEIDPTNDEAKFLLAKLLFGKGEIEAAARELERIKNIEGIEIDYYYMLTTYYEKVKKFDKLKKALEKAVLGNEQKDEKLTKMRYQLAVMKHEDGELETAYEMFQLVKEGIPRYKDSEQRIKILKKILFPEEHAKIIESIDYNKLTNNEFEDFFYKIVDVLGLKKAKGLQKNRNRISIVAVEKFKTLLQGAHLIEIVRSFDLVTDGEIVKFQERMEDENATEGILITTSSFTDEAIKAVKKSKANIKLMDKVNIYELMS